MILPTLFGLVIVGIEDPGIPNRERIVLRPTEHVNLIEFIIALGLPQSNGMIMPLMDQAFWFPEWAIEPPGWVYLYTGVGDRFQSKDEATGQPVYYLFWGKRRTVFGDGRLAPVIFSLGGISIGQPPPPYSLPPQLGSGA